MQETNRQPEKVRRWYKKWWGALLIVFGGLLALPAVLIIPIAIISTVISSDETPESSEGSSQSITPETKPETVAELDAKVAYNASVISLQNNEAVPWGRCTYKLNSKYKNTSNPIIPAGGVIDLALLNFVDNNNVRFNVYKEKPDYLRIECFRDGTQSATGDYFFQ